MLPNLSRGHPYLPGKMTFDSELLTQTLETNVAKKQEIPDWLMILCGSFATVTEEPAVQAAALTGTGFLTSAQVLVCPGVVPASDGSCRLEKGEERG